MQVYKLDRARFYSASNINLDTMLNTTAVKLDLLQGFDQLLFFGKGFRGGLNNLKAPSHFGAKNKYLESFNSKDDFTFGAVLT